MDSTVKTAIIAAFASVVGALVTATATIWASEKRVDDAVKDAKAATQKTEQTLATLQRYEYVNGERKQTPLRGGKMVVRINGSKRGPVSQPIDMERLREMCGDSDGCTISLGATRFRRNVAIRIAVGELPETSLFGPPCRFFYDRSTKYWTLSTSCVVRYATARSYAADGGWRWEIDKAFEPYRLSNSYGKDDDSESRIIVDTQGACFLAEAAANPLSRRGEFMPDSPNDPSGRGLFLIASSPLWDPAYPQNVKDWSWEWPSDDESRQCVLVVDD